MQSLFGKWPLSPAALGLRLCRVFAEFGAPSLPPRLVRCPGKVPVWLLLICLGKGSIAAVIVALEA